MDACFGEHSSELIGGLAALNPGAENNFLDPSYETPLLVHSAGTDVAESECTVAQMHGCPPANTTPIDTVGTSTSGHPSDTYRRNASEAEGEASEVKQQTIAAVNNPQQRAIADTEVGRASCQPQELF
ncbi:unnamed protein product [Boreogadus saida]